MGKHNIVQTMKNQKTLLLFIFPGVIFYILFMYYPMYGLIMAFQDFNPVYGFSDSPFVGLKNFKFIFSTPNFQEVLRNTVVISLLKLLFGQPVPIILALMIIEVKSIRLKKTIQTISYMPHFLSWVVAAGLWYNFLAGEGIVNSLLLKLNLLDKPIFFLGNKSWAYPIIIFTSIWKQVGFGSIIYLAALSGINPELYESATVDGAGKLRQIWHISLPGIKPTIVVLFILAVSNLMRAGFDQIQAFLNPQIKPVINVIDTEVFKLLTTGGIMQLSIGAALGFFQALVGVMLFIIANLFFRTIKEESII